MATATHAFPTLLRNNPPTDAPPKPQAQHFYRLCWVDIQRNLGQTIHRFVFYHLLIHNFRLFPYGSGAYESSAARPGSARRNSVWFRYRRASRDKNVGATVRNGRVRGRRRRQPPSGSSGNYSAANIGCKPHCRIYRLLNWHSFRFQFRPAKSISISSIKGCASPALRNSAKSPTMMVSHDLWS
jgi:hypothetical protein